MSPKHQTLLRSVREMNGRDARFVLRASALALTLPGLLRSLPLPDLVAWIARSPRRLRCLPEPKRMVQLTDRVLKRGRGPFRANCVVRSLILLRYLRRRGEPASVCFGVRRDSADGIDGHAWISLDGQPLGEVEDPRPLYRLTYRFPDEAPH